MPTNISWTDESWNPVTGCSPISEGCAHCYAKKMTERFGGDFSKVTLHPDRLEIPLHWRKPRMVFVPSMGDLFHDDVPDEFLMDVFDVMAGAQRHTFQVLTKRPKRMKEFMEHLVDEPYSSIWPVSNVWLGVSVENQARADERIPLLLDTPAAVRLVSAEPLLGPLDLTPWLPKHDVVAERLGECRGCASYQELDWVIVGGESGGPPERRLVERCGRPHRLNWKPKPGTFLSPADCCDCHGTGWRPKPEALEWLRSLRDQCQAAGVAFFLKQLGPRAGQGTLLDGVEHREMPEGEKCQP